MLYSFAWGNGTTFRPTTGAAAALDAYVDAPGARAALDMLPHVPRDGELDRPEHAQQSAGHASPKTTKLYDRTAANTTTA